MGAFFAKTAFAHSVYIRQRRRESDAFRTVFTKGDITDAKTATRSLPIQTSWMRRGIRNRFFRENGHTESISTRKRRRVSDALGPKVAGDFIEMGEITEAAAAPWGRRRQKFRKRRNRRNRFCRQLPFACRYSRNQRLEFEAFTTADL